jgi:uncharacterized protein YacL
MAWDSKRPVPWKQLLRLVGMFVVLINVFLYFTSKGKYNINVFLTTILAGAMYLLFTVVLAKFGMDPISQRQKRAEAVAARRAAKQAAAPSKENTSGGRRRSVVDTKARPAPTSRTNAGNRQPRKR